MPTSYTELKLITAPAVRLELAHPAALLGVEAQGIRAGVAAAKKRGVKFGRPAWKTRPYRTIKPSEVKRLRKKGVPMAEIARRLGVSRQACYYALQA